MDANRLLHRHRFCWSFRRPRHLVIFALVAICFSWTVAWAQSGLDDDRVMLQGFYWESYRHGHPDKFPNYGKTGWYEIVTQQASVIRDGRFDLIWLPPPSYAGAFSVGYDPKEYFTLESSYGTLQQHRRMLEALLQHGVEPVADIVINHRNGSQRWADFNNPAWDTRSITKYDEAFTNPDSEVFNLPDAQRGAEEEIPSEYALRADRLTPTAAFAISIIRIRPSDATSCGISWLLSPWAIAAGGMTWSMAITRAGWPFTTRRRDRRSQWVNMTGAHRMNNADGYGIRRRILLQAEMIT
jgi:Glycosidases